MQKPVEKPIKFVKNLLTKGKSYPITHTEAVIDNNGNTLSLILDGGISGGGGLTETTWLELKNKRDAGELTPGSLYRITDYNCTTTQENTRSAGHQFDIVLLALSANKLAEEGWAMMNESNIYDVTFADVVTKKCWVYRDDNYDNIVDCESLLGIEGFGSDEVEIDETTKTVTTSVYVSTELVEENLTYNYFQNSKLEAWKVWYCLDNDTARFAWADGANEEPAYIKINNNNYNYYRRADKDQGNYFAWKAEESSNALFTLNEVPSAGDEIYYNKRGAIILHTDTVASYYPPGVEENGRGVIYRLIDEWNNDVGYDFKNILINDGNGTYYYTFSGLLNTEIIDCSTLYTSNPAVHIASNNTICRSFMRDKQYINGVFIYDEDNVGFGDMKVSSTAIGEFQPRTGCLVNYSFYEEEEPSQEIVS